MKQHLHVHTSRSASGIGGKQGGVGLRRLAIAAAAAAALVVLGDGPAAAEPSKNIRDNSFLLEEAYNQEPGVIQHIQVFQLMDDHSWGYSFTEEWPVPRETHQLSVTLPVAHLEDGADATGIGDIMLNYRYQLVLNETVAFAPRLSPIFPSGDNSDGLGDDAFGLQLNLPLSIELGEDWVTHWNMGATNLFEAKGPDGTRQNKASVNYGASLIYLASETANFLLEAVGGSSESIESDGTTGWEQSFFLNPGVRFALNFVSGLQVVPGIGFPIGIGPSRGEYGVLLYLSFEHPAF